MTPKPVFPKNLIFYNEREMCNRPPDGWWCSRKPGHDGPCAARPRPIRFSLPVWVWPLLMLASLVSGMLTARFLLSR